MPNGNRSTRARLYAAPVFLLCSVLIPRSAMCDGLEQRMEIRDLSDKGSPIQIAGHMTLRYDKRNRFAYSYQENFTIKNVSAKSILLMVVHFEATSGPGRDERFSQEYFFGEVLEPGGVETPDSSEQRFGASSVNGVPVPYEPDPHPAAQARAEFVQFSDGSTWGDAESASETLEIRRKTLAELDLLEHFYEQKGESAFLEELGQGDDDLNVIRQLRVRCDHNARYVDCAHNGVHQTFLVARDHEAALSGAVVIVNGRQ